MSLFGRDHELAAVHDLIARIGEGGSSLLVVGEAGIGKSSILAEATSFAHERGLTVLAATGIQAETQLACSGLHQLLRPILDRVDDLPVPQGNALRAAFGMTSEAAPDLFLTALSTLELLSEVAESAPMLVVADDAQWLDQATGDVLAFLARRLADEPIVLIVAIRDGFDSPLLNATLREMPLERLAPDAAERVLDGHATSLSPEDRARVLRQAIGNPLALIELAEAGAVRDGAGVALLDPSSWPALTERLERAFSARVRDLPPATKRFLLVAALDDEHGLSESLRAAAILEGTSPPELDVAGRRSGDRGEGHHRRRRRDPLPAPLDPIRNRAVGRPVATQRCPRRARGLDGRPTRPPHLASSGREPGPRRGDRRGPRSSRRPGGPARRHRRSDLGSRAGRSNERHLRSAAAVGCSGRRSLPPTWGATTGWGGSSARSGPLTTRRSSSGVDHGCWPCRFAAR